MRRQSDGTQGFRFGRLPGIVAIAVAALVGMSGCEKKSKEDEIRALEPDFNAIADQLRHNALESGVRKSGEKWTKFVLIPLTADFRLTNTLSQSEPHRLLIAIKYRMKTLSKPVETAALAKAAAYDAQYEFLVNAQLSFQDDRWYIDTLSSQAPASGPVDRPTVNALLQKSIRRML